MFKRILVPVDGSHTSGLGLKQAIAMARAQRARLFILHVVDETVLTQSADMAGAGFDRLLDSLREGGKRILAKARLQAERAGLKPRAVLVENYSRRVADVIVGQARKVKADTIVIGTHGRRGISRLVMGSDAEGVVRAAPVPVLLVRSKPGKQSRA